jgi:hypothetical protein
MSRTRNYTAGVLQGAGELRESVRLRGTGETDLACVTVSNSTVLILPGSAPQSASASTRQRGEKRHGEAPQHGRDRDAPIPRDFQAFTGEQIRPAARRTRGKP